MRVVYRWHDFSGFWRKPILWGFATFPAFVNFAQSVVHKVRSCGRVGRITMPPKNHFSLCASLQAYEIELSTALYCLCARETFVVKLMSRSIRAERCDRARASWRMAAATAPMRPALEETLREQRDRKRKIRKQHTKTTKLAPCMPTRCHAKGVRGHHVRYSGLRY